MRLYNNNNINHLFISPYCNYDINDDHIVFFNYLLKKEVRLNSSKENLLKFITFLENGINYTELKEFMGTWNHVFDVENIIYVLIFNGVIE